MSESPKVVNMAQPEMPTIQTQPDAADKKYTANIFCSETHLPKLFVESIRKLEFSRRIQGFSWC